MPLPRTKLVGFICVAAGLILYGTWIGWLSTRTERPVDIPISMAIGHVRTREFKINLNALFTIDIEVQKTIPFETLNCLLGTAMGRTSTDLQECPDKPSVVKAYWVLSSNGQIVAQGSSDDYRSGAWMNDAISRELGHFQSQSGRIYVLDVNVLADGTALTPGNPRLKVGVHPEVYEDNMVRGFMFLVVTGVSVLVGIILLGISAKRAHQEPPSSPSDKH
jgi:hypothetical protein